METTTLEVHRVYVYEEGFSLRIWASLRLSELQVQRATARHSAVLWCVWSAEKRNKKAP